MNRKQKNIMLIRNFCERFGFGYPRAWMLAIMALITLGLVSASYWLFMFATQAASIPSEQASLLTSHAPHVIMLFTAFLLLLGIKAADLMCELSCILLFFYSELNKKRRDDDAS